MYFSICEGFPRHPGGSFGYMKGECDHAQMLQEFVCIATVVVVQMATQNHDFSSKMIIFLRFLEKSVFGQKVDLEILPHELPLPIFKKLT